MPETTSAASTARHLPDAFRVIRLELAREPGHHPAGDAGHGYDLLVPLDASGRIDAEIVRDDPARCRVRRFRPGEADAIGRLVHGPGGAWLIDYGRTGPAALERGFNFADERFVHGEYVSIREDDTLLHTFKVTSVREP